MSQGSVCGSLLARSPESTLSMISPLSRSPAAPCSPTPGLYPLIRKSHGIHCMGCQGNGTLFLAAIRTLNNHNLYSVSTVPNLSNGRLNAA